MGWSFSMWPSHDKAAQVKQNLASFAAGEVIQSSVVGNHHWVLFRDTGNGIKRIVLFLMAPPGKGEKCGWGYKAIGEDSGPAAIDCPVGIIKGADEPQSETSAAWRAEVLAFHAAKRDTARATKALAPGVEFVYNGQRMRVVIKDPRRPGVWIARGVHDGAQMAFRSGHLADLVAQHVAFQILRESEPMPKHAPESEPAQLCLG